MVALPASPKPAPALPPPPLLTADAALFLDLDGTLLDFAAQPHHVVVADGLPEILRLLHGALGGALAIISGRSLAQIDQFDALPVMATAGLHGAQIRTADGLIVSAPSHAPSLDAARRAAVEHVAAIPGMLIEDKLDAIAVHFRGAPHAADDALAIGQKLLDIAGTGFTLQHGNHVVEVRPRGSDKGSALERLLRERAFLGRTPWMLGDDFTDEAAFTVANRLAGTSVIVGPRRPTDARYALRDPDAVRRWLAMAAAHFGH